MGKRKLKTLSDLEKIHNEVKNQKFRLHNTARYVKSFNKACDELCAAFEDVARGVLDKEHTESLFYFCHEMLSTSWSLEYVLTKEDYDGKKEKGELIAAMESYISQIHKFIQSNAFDSFTTYYTGDNIKKDQSRWSNFVFKKGKGFIKTGDANEKR